MQTRRHVLSNVQPHTFSWLTWRVVEFTVYIGGGMIPNRLKPSNSHPVSCSSFEPTPPRAILVPITVKPPVTYKHNGRHHYPTVTAERRFAPLRGGPAVSWNSLYTWIHDRAEPWNSDSERFFGTVALLLGTFQVLHSMKANRHFFFPH